jgi:hypothetical protein
MVDQFSVLERKSNEPFAVQTDARIEWAMQHWRSDVRGPDA